MYFLGLTSPSDWPYLLWSGFAADLSELAIFSVAMLWYQHRKCVSCWRNGKHHVEGTAWLTCHVHLTRHDHDRLIREYENRFPEQYAFLNTERADSENLIQP